MEVIVLASVGLAATVLTAYAAWHWQGDRYLCDTCKFNSAEKCNKPERPKAVTCLAFEESKY